MIQYIAFTADREFNRAALREGLLQTKPDFIAVKFSDEVLQGLQPYFPNADCFPSSAEVYPNGDMNVFVKEATNAPAIGFIRVRSHT